MAYLALLASLALLYVRPGDLSPAFAGWPLLPIAGGLLTVSILLAFAARTLKPAWGPQMNWLLGTWFAFVFSHVGHTYLDMTIRTFKGFFTNVFVGVTVFFVLSTRKRLRGFATLWILLSLFLAIGGIVQQATGVGFGGQPLVKGRIQGVGIFADPNDLGLAFLIAVPLARARFWAAGGPAWLLFYPLMGIFTYAMFLTNSRGGILSLALVFFLLSARRFGRKLGIAVGTVLVLALLAFGPSRVSDIDSTEASAQGRIAAWSEGLQMFKRHPVIGVGYGMFTDYHDLTAHNSFVLCFAETGFLGAFFWLGLLYVSILALRRVVKAAPTGPPDGFLRQWALDTEIALVGFLSGAFFLSRTYNVVLYVLIGFAAALCRVAREEIPEAGFRVTGRDRRRIALLVVGGIAFTYLLVKTLAVWTGNFY
jgi:O-antigen ligase